MCPDPDDSSSGWNSVAGEFIAQRSSIGVATVCDWAGSLPAGASVLDLGCGHGVPISTALARRGFAVYGIDASRDLVEEFRRNLPDAPAKCEAVESSTFFKRRFDAAIAIGLVFLLSAERQRQLILRVSDALRAGGRFLFTSPMQAVVWQDILTGRQSRSLGRDAYESILSEAGLTLVSELTDEGNNHYYSTTKSR